MSSIIEGYNYDIFISYRQKDNKGDMWVSEFVEALKTELESTFKEEISVYFDINPHDGLLETHDVDESLKDKLKCLVFIPIISRTYCDPKSFAWEHEFKAFVEQASNDKYGLKVKLPNGNVESRVLPVQIHDLDNEDQKLCESVLDGVLRSIEFIYKEPGIDKPLAPDDDEKKNLNNTKYKIQIVKVAHAIKDIISAIQHYHPLIEEVSQEVIESESESESEPEPELVPVPQKRKKTPIILGSIIALALIILGVLFIPKLFKPSEEPEKSIAVLPFQNFSVDTDQDAMCYGLTDEIINHLYKIASFDIVKSLNTVLTYVGTSKKTPEIAKELNVNYILEGTYKKIGEQVRVTAQLIEAKTDKHIWQNEYDRPYEEIIEIQSDIAVQIATHIKAFLTETEKQNIQKVPTVNQEAYELVKQAVYFPSFSDGTYSVSIYELEFDQRLNNLFRAIELDPHYADAYASLGRLYLSSGNYLGNREMQTVAWDAKYYLEKALEIDPDNGYAHGTLAQLNDWFLWDYIKAEAEFLKTIDLLPNDPNVYTQYGDFLMKMNRLEDAKPYFALLKVPYTDRNRELQRLELANNNKETYNFMHEFLDLYNESAYRWIGHAFIHLHEYDSARFYLESAIKANDLTMNIPRFRSCMALAYYKTGDPKQAKNIINELIQQSDTTTAGSPDFFTGWYYSWIGEVDSAFYWLEKAYHTRSAEMPWLKTSPAFNNLKDDPRYWDLYERTGHKAYDEYLASKKNN